MQRKFESLLSLALAVTVLSGFCSFGSAAATEKAQTAGSSNVYTSIDSVPDNIRALLKSDKTAQVIKTNGLKNTDTAIDNTTRILENDNPYSLTTENADGKGKVNIIR